MSGLLLVYDPSRKLGLTDPSPGGGSVPVVYRCGCGVWGHRGCASLYGAAPAALLLRSEDGTLDPIGMARARDVLEKVMSPVLARRVGSFALREPDAIARLLAEHAGCEVHRG